MAKEEILKQADQYVGYPEEIDESLEAYSTRRAFVDGAEWMQKKMIDKACEWWRKQFDGYDSPAFLNSIIEDFRKAMEK